MLNSSKKIDERDELKQQMIMATLRFNMVEFASTMGMEAMIRVMTECFGRKALVATKKSSDVKLSKEVQRLQNEARYLNKWVINSLIPMAGSYQALLLDRDKQIYTLYSPEEVEAIMYQDNYQIEEITRQIASIYLVASEIGQECKAVNNLTDERSILWAYNNTIAARMEKLREYSDKLRDIIGLGNN